MPFIEIPGFSKYSINEHGEVRNISTGKAILPKSDKPTQIQIFGDDGRRERINFKEMAGILFGNPEETTVNETASAVNIPVIGLHDTVTTCPVKENSECENISPLNHKITEFCTAPVEPTRAFKTTREKRLEAARASFENFKKSS